MPGPCNWSDAVFLQGATDVVSAAYGSAAPLTNRGVQRSVDDLNQAGSTETSRVLQAELRSRINGEVRFDRTSRMLYSTDASNYQIEPVGVVIPKSIDDAIGAIELAASHDVPILPRGGGSSLAGQTVGAALVIDFSKYLSRVIDLDLDTHSVLVEPGINLDSLNRQVRANGLMFGPDPSSANRATVGGVVGNNSHRRSFDSLRHDRRQRRECPRCQRRRRNFRARTGRGRRSSTQASASDPRGRLLTKLLAFQEQHVDLIRRDFPPHWRRSTGYSLDEFLKPAGGVQSGPVAGFI